MKHFVKALTVSGDEYSANTTVCLTFANGEHVDISLDPLQAIQLAGTIYRVVKPEDYMRMKGHKQPHDPHGDY